MSTPEAVPARTRDHFAKAIDEHCTRCSTTAPDEAEVNRGVVGMSLQELISLYEEAGATNAAEYVQRMQEACDDCNENGREEATLTGRYTCGIWAGSMEGIEDT